MRISIFGLGYVGAVSAACLARNGHQVTGVDPDGIKVDLVNEGKSPILEPGLRELLAEHSLSGRVRATADVREAIMQTDVSFICVGTPSRADGSLDLGYVERVCEQIGDALRHKPGWHVVVMRSTVLPGTARKLVIPTLESYSRKTAGVEFGFCVNPEFLREGTAIFDYDHPPKVVVGPVDETSLYNMVTIYGHLEAPFLQTTLEVAEAVKYTDNAWHAVKVNFGNEIGAICEKAGVDPHAVIDVFCRDEKLNISKAYLRPGLAFGGSCLPKDVRALNHFAKSMEVDVPMLNAVLNANERQIQRAIQKVEATGDNEIGVLGLSFKAGTDDLRESPMLRIVEELHRKGFNIRIYDPYVLVASTRGANPDYIVNRIPHINRMLCPDLQEFADHSRTMVIGNQSPLYRGLMKRIGRGRKIVDLVHLLPAARSKPQAAVAYA